MLRPTLLTATFPIFSAHYILERSDVRRCPVMTRVSFSCVALFLFTLPSAAGDDLYRCTIKDVVEITSLGTIGRRPTLTQAEMTCTRRSRLSVQPGQFARRDLIPGPLGCCSS